MSKSTSIIVTVTDNKLKDIQKVAEDLKIKGMTVERVMPITGVISGSLTSNKFQELEGIEGVMSVEKEETAYLPPAGSSVQ